MKKRNIIGFGLVLAVIFAMSACKRTLPDFGRTSTVKFSNGWWANLYLGGVAQYAKPAFINTYNTSAGDSLWVDDLGNLWDFKVKVGIDQAGLTFSTKSAANEYYPITVTITDGKVLPKMGHSTTGLATDSIYMKVVFSDDPTNTYEIKGTARTGQIADDF
jgi:hypothetical protein